MMKVLWISGGLLALALIGYVQYASTNGTWRYDPKRGTPAGSSLVGKRFTIAHKAWVTNNPDDADLINSPKSRWITDVSVEPGMIVEVLEAEEVGQQIPAAGRNEYYTITSEDPLAWKVRIVSSPYAEGKLHNGKRRIDDRISKTGWIPARVIGKQVPQ